MIDPTGIRARFTLLLPHLDERRRRLFAATEAPYCWVWRYCRRVVGHRHRGEHDRSGLEGAGHRCPAGGGPGSPSWRRAQAAGGDGRGPALRPKPDWAEVHRELRRPDVTLTLLWEEYKARELDGF